MKESLNLVKTEIINLIKNATVLDWETAELKFDFPPLINKGYSASQIVKDVAGKNVRLVKYNEKFEQVLFDFIIKFNQENQFNQIVFNTKRNDYDNATIKLEFNKEVDYKFWAAIPKSQQKGIVPWYRQK